MMKTMTTIPSNELFIFLFLPLLLHLQLQVVVQGEIIERSSECHPADRICEINERRDECVRPFTFLDDKLVSGKHVEFWNQPYYPFEVDKELDLGVSQLYDPLEWGWGWEAMDEFRDRYVSAIQYKEDLLDEDNDDRDKEKEIATTTASPPCRLENERCLEYAWLDDLCFHYQANTHRWMALNCCAACEDVDFLEWYKRCQPPHPKETLNPYKKPGDMNTAWIRTLAMLSNEGFDFRVHAAPINITEELAKTMTTTTTIQSSFVLGDDADNHKNMTDSRRFRSLPTTIDYEYKIGGPWIVTIENYVTVEERERLRHHAEAYGYERSQDGNARVMKHRTSFEAGCTNRTQCNTDPIVQGLVQRISNHLGIPSSHMDERLQLLRYSTGQQYKVHQDYHQIEAYGLTGARIATFYMYLSNVDKGGETWFPYLDLKITPKAGRAVAWSNVLNEEPFEEDRYARHAGLPVQEGVKYGATAWFRHHYNRNVPDDCFVG